jgi:hypothetical protein
MEDTLIVCAWCEQEGRPAILYETPDDSSLAWEGHSHGICKAHRDRLLMKIQISSADESVTLPLASNNSRAVLSEPVLDLIFNYRWFLT